ncbi:MAG: hypothetical protein HGA33_00750 [Candidatus Moranbacteria bacterium]|nr:hypothetical protein [Candidatus Moranbacteria bacterium]
MDVIKTGITWEQVHAPEVSDSQAYLTSLLQEVIRAERLDESSMAEPGLNSRPEMYETRFRRDGRDWIGRFWPENGYSASYDRETNKMVGDTPYPHQEEYTIVKQIDSMLDHWYDE